MVDHHRSERTDESEYDRDLADLARYDPENDVIEVGPTGSHQTYDMELARRIRDALDAAIREAEADRLATTWVDDMVYPDEGPAKSYK